MESAFSLLGHRQRSVTNRVRSCNLSFHLRRTCTCNAIQLRSQLQISKLRHKTSTLRALRNTSKTPACDILQGSLTWDIPHLYVMIFSSNRLNLIRQTTSVPF